MTLNPNHWSKLVGQGRAKAIGVSWSEDEMSQIIACKNLAEREKLIAKLRGEVATETKTEEKGGEVGSVENEPIKDSDPVAKTKAIKKTKIKK